MSKKLVSSHLSYSTKASILMGMNEKTFRDEVLLPLFQNMKYETKLTHGPNEEGKDFLLAKIDDFGETKYICVVVKAGDINNIQISKEKNTLWEVQRQVEQCWTIPLDKYGADGKLPSKVIVALSGRLSDKAEFEINKKITNYNKSNLTFLPQEKLIPLSRYPRASPWS